MYPIRPPHLTLTPATASTLNTVQHYRCDNSVYVIGAPKEKRVDNVPSTVMYTLYYYVCMCVYLTNNNSSDGNNEIVTNE